MLDARAQLNKHITANDQIILLSRQRFRTASEAITLSLQNGDSLPKPKKARDEDSKMFNLAKYFDVVGADIPALYFVYRVLSKCSASEAPLRQFFSSEGAIHNKLQNRLNPEAVVKVSWNQEPIKRLVHSLGSELQDEELQDEELQDEDCRMKNCRMKNCRMKIAG